VRSAQGTINREPQSDGTGRDHVDHDARAVVTYREEGIMPKYVIERELPGAGALSTEQLQGISRKSCSVLRDLGPQVQWLHSYVTGDKICCVYIAPNGEMVREHAKQGGFPANVVSEVKAIIDPTTAD
jgi:hypothetical protein